MGTGAREIYPNLDQVNKVRSKDSKGFSSRKQMISKKKVFTEIAKDFPLEIANSSSFSGRIQVISKKKGLHPKNVMKSVVSQQKTPIWASICTPVAPILLISSGHSLRLGGHSFRLGGHMQSFGVARPRYAPPWRRVW